MGLVSVLKRQNKLDEAETTCTSAMQTFEKLGGPCHPKTIGALAQLAQIVHRAGRQKDADALMADLQLRKYVGQVVLRPAQESWSIQNPVFSGQGMTWLRSCVLS